MAGRGEWRRREHRSGVAMAGWRRVETGKLRFFWNSPPLVSKARGLG
jgi:hypothetical protein